MDVNYTYWKKRRVCGAQPLFCEVPSHMLDSIVPDKTEQSKYILRNPVHNFSEAGAPQSIHEINTKQVKKVQRGANHLEGGWPKEVDYLDDEAVVRFRKRNEREENYINIVMNNAGKFEHYLKQNNAIEMYQMYFREIPPRDPIQTETIVIKNIFIDQDQRPISCIDWTSEEESKLIVSYCTKKYPVTGPSKMKKTCFIWKLANPYEPFLSLEPPSFCWRVAASPVNANIIVGGLQDGRVCLFDTRIKETPQAISPAHLAHRDPVSSLIYYPSRSNVEFFSSSTDGLVAWHDIRNLSEPIETMVITMEPPIGEQPHLGNSDPVSVLQYDKSYPTKFTCGTDTGYVVYVNRKGKKHSEQMCAIYRAHNGPVKAIHRNSLSGKIFITCGDNFTHIWNEDATTSPIIPGSPRRHTVNDVCWSPQRYSSFMNVSSTGVFYYWDLLRRYTEPIITLPLSKNPILVLKCHEEGRLVANGDNAGALYLLKMSEALAYPSKSDKGIMLQMFERETKREHIVANRIKEIFFALQQGDKSKEGLVEGKSELAINDDEVQKQTEADFFKIVSDEKKLIGGLYETTQKTEVKKKA